jgi:hypothetical protein
MMYLIKNAIKIGLTTTTLLFVLAGLSTTVIAGDEGCVSCHAGPLALNTLVTERVENHADVGPMINTVPNDCLMCHAKGSPMGLMEAIHTRHEGVSCDSCHVIDADSGMPSALKSGAKNW